MDNDLEEIVLVPKKEVKKPNKDPKDWIDYEDDSVQNTIMIKDVT